MNHIWTFLLDLLAQFGAGRGDPENELVRFGLAAIFWAVLMVVAWSRRCQEAAGRERLLVWGFGLGLFRELFMFGVNALVILGIIDFDSLHTFFPPLEHTLSMAAVIVIADAFLLYILEDSQLSRRYLQVGLGAAVFCYLATFWWWAEFITAHPGFRFGQTWCDWLFRVTASVLIGVAIVLLARQQGPVRNLVIVALFMFFLDEFLMLFNLASGDVYKEVYNPIRQNLHIWAIPVLGYVYAKEMSIQVEERTKQLRGKRAELAASLSKLQKEVTERKRAEEWIQRQLQRESALRAIGMAVSASMDLTVVFNVLLEQVTGELNVDAAEILLLNPHTRMLEYAAGRGFRSNAITRSCVRLGDGQAGRAALEGTIVYISNLSDAEDDFLRAQLLADEAFVACVAVPLIVKGRVKGLLDLFHRVPLDPEPGWQDFLAVAAAQVAIAIDNAELFGGLQRANVELTVAYDATIEGWARALELRDTETEGHSLRVTEMTLRLARAMGMREEELVHVRRSALLHDIGKIGIPDSILLKPTDLTEEEREVMQRHPVYAYELLSPIPYLQPVLDIPYCHHERWDGTGYPRGLKEEQIPLPARIFAVVDVYDALRSDRPYRKAWPEEKVRAYIRAQAGRQFDPRVVEVFLRLLEDGLSC